MVDADLLSKLMIKRAMISAKQNYFTTNLYATHLARRYLVMWLRPAGSLTCQESGPGKKSNAA